MKLPQVRTKKMADLKPDLEMTAEEMMVVGRWLEFAFDDVCKQISSLRPPNVLTKEHRKRAEISLIGNTYLQNWLKSNLDRIESELTKAGLLPRINLEDASTDRPN